MRRAWTEAEEKVLMTMFLQNKRMGIIAKQLNRTIVACQERVKQIRRAKGTSPASFKLGRGE